MVQFKFKKNVTVRGIQAILSDNNNNSWNSFKLSMRLKCLNKNNYVITHISYA